ncbi:MAG: RES domain-containing protein [Rhodospirillales bacterium]|nr:RES domain-containing protein [Rhodospirillales bacterium]
MRVWRLAPGRHSGLDGEGARRYGGRWNNPGTPVVYAATHLSLSVLEQLVHVSLELLPTAFRAFAIELPASATIERFDRDALTANDTESTRRYGDLWAASARAAALIVPSVLVPPHLGPGAIPTEERNVILNPRHPSASAWRVTETSFAIDPRLRREA